MVDRHTVVKDSLHGMTLVIRMRCIFSHVNLPAMGPVSYTHLDVYKRQILENFLSSHRAEVLDVILTDYNEQEYIAMEREEAWEEGRAEGLSVSREAILDLLGEHGEVPEELRARICAESDKETLKRWTKLAAKAESLEVFASKYDS